MNVRLPFVQVFILIVFSSLFSFLLNGLRSNGIPLLAKELAVADKVEIKVKKKSTSLGIELGGNESIIEQLGLTEEQLPVIGGIIGIIFVVFGGLIYYRRKGREYE